mmetsp:Transcript_88193/g.284852  ORF Transcript_88193/g.284852 Transcript_88193/m.284852 type:complete len:380 (-) Transcript_88193:317-1456(-)
MAALLKKRKSKTLSSHGLADVVESEITVATRDGGMEATDENAAEKKKQQKERLSWYIKDPEVIEGLLVTLGVISALIFANIIALQCTVKPAEMARGDFAFLLRGSPEFRQFAKTVWTEEGKSFNARIGVGPDEVFDVRAVLDNLSGEWLEDWISVKISEFATTFQHMEADFPMAKMQVWKTWHGVSTSSYGGSDHVTISGTVAYVFAGLALFNSVTMYVSFAYSPVKEEYEAAKKRGEPEPPASLVRWTKIIMPVILFSYVLLIQGVGQFLFSTGSINHIRYLYSSQAWFCTRLQYYFAMPMLAVFTFVLPIWAFVSSRGATCNLFGGRRVTPVAGKDGLREVPLVGLSEAVNVQVSGKGGLLGVASSRGHHEADQAWS